MPLFYGLSWLPLVPRRRPVTTLVGPPLWPPEVVADPTAENLCLKDYTVLQAIANDRNFEIR